MSLTRTPLVAICGCLALLVTACGDGLSIIGTQRGSGDIVSQPYGLNEFSELDVAAGFVVQVEVDPTAEPRVQVQTDDNLIEFIEVEQNGARVSIGIESGSYSFSELSALVTVPSLELLNLSGGTTAAVNGLTGDSFAISGSGGSEVTLDGTTELLTIDISGGSTVRASELKSGRVILDQSGGSASRVWASDSVIGSASGGATVEVKGAASVDIEQSGGSEVKLVGE